MPSNIKKDLSRRLPAEWEPQDAIMLVWPHRNTDWAPILDEVITCFKNIVTNILSFGEQIVIVADESCQDLPQPLRLIKVVRCPTNDTWARDTCALTTFLQDRAIINDFKFNGWGLKFPANFDNLITADLFDKGIFNGDYANHLNFAFEGGSIESDGNGTLLTTSRCLLSQNRNGGYTKSEIERYLLETFGSKQIHWLDYGYLAGDDTDSHIDTLARFAPDDTILYVGTDDVDDEHYEELKNMEFQLQSFRTIQQTPYRLIKLPLPSPIYDETGQRLPATYANFLIGNGFVLVPIYNQVATDELAIDLISQAFSNHKVVGIDCRVLIKQHGSLHCVTMQFPSNSLNL